MKRAWAWLLIFLPAAAPRTLTFDVPIAVDPALWTYAPSWAVQHARMDALGQLQLEVTGPVRIANPALCPIEEGKPVQPRLQIRGETSQVGYDAPIELHAITCSDEPVQWRQVEGQALAEWNVAGAMLRARTLPLGSYFPSLPDGLVPVSPRTQGRYVVEAAVGTMRSRVVITSVARATGLTSLATDQTVMLRKAGWHLTAQPRGSAVQVQAHEDVETFRADRVGAYKLTRDDGQTLELRVLTHERTPMDCGRSDCHASEAQRSLQNPMSHAFERADSCMIGCHTTGELGIDDGGFSHLQREHGRTSLTELPRPLQRLAGVRCTACHGPGAIPSEQGRARILRTDVCATCHDAPPRYGQVEAWRHSSMARADADPLTRSEGRCAGCHTTGGFLNRIGARKHDSRDPDGRAIGLSCVTCHAPHAKVGPRLVRDMDLCASCHSPLPDDVLPSASAATIVRGKLDLGSLHLERPAVHGDCISCHGAGAKLDHSFAVVPETCNNCHTDKTIDRAEGEALTLEARSMREKLGCASLHDAPCSPSEALYLIELVEQDRGAAWHNPAFARALLTTAGSLPARRDAGARSP